MVWLCYCLEGWLFLASFLLIFLCIFYETLCFTFLCHLFYLLCCLLHEHAWKYDHIINVNLPSVHLNSLQISFSILGCIYLVCCVTVKRWNSYCFEMQHCVLHFIPTIIAFAWEVIMLLITKIKAFSAVFTHKKLLMTHVNNQVFF